MRRVMKAIYGGVKKTGYLVKATAWAAVRTASP